MLLSPVDSIKMAEVEHKLARFSKKYDLPAYVKSAAMHDTLMPEGLEVTQYADQRHRQFPCHTKAAAWCSVADYLEQAAAMPATHRERVSKNLYKLANFWNILDDIVQMKPAPIEKAAEAQTQFFVWQDRTTGNRAMPIGNSQDVPLAAAWLEKNASQFAFSQRCSMARNILAAKQHFLATAGEHEDYLQKAAGYGFCDPQVACRAIRARASVNGDPQWKEKLTKLAASVQDSPQLALTPENLVSLAGILDTADSLTRKPVFRKTSSLVENELFGITYKAAGALAKDICQTTTGNTYSKTDLAELKLTELRDLLGDEFADNVQTGLQVDAEKMAAVLATAPRDDAELFDKYARSRGVSPVRSKSAGSRDIGFTAEQLQALIG